MNDALHVLLSAAIRAPSGDNMQPWRFEVDAGAGRITFFVDETRDPSPMNAGQRMARIAIGAALENVLRAARASGWEAQIEAAQPPAVGAVRVLVSSSSPQVERLLAERVTNRRAYDTRPISADILERLKAQTPESDGVLTHWIAGRERLEPLADVIGQADATMFGEVSMRRAFLHNIRFDAAIDAEVEEGLSLASLEVSAKDRAALRMMPWMPGWLLRLAGGLRVFAANARRLINSASGLCVVATGDRSAATDVTVGRALQCAWLALTGEGLAVQPMMSLPVLDNALDNGGAELIAASGCEKVQGLLADFRRLVPEVGDGRVACLLRFGYAPPPSGRTGRRPVDAVTREVSRGGVPVRESAPHGGVTR